MGLAGVGDAVGEIVTAEEFNAVMADHRRHLNIAQLSDQSFSKAVQDYRNSQAASAAR